MNQKTRIAVLGGGAGALCAVHELTREPGWRERFDITVYQLGWRCGGKGASGRNRELNHRVEEHGLHILLGCYDMTFRLLREAWRHLEDTTGAAPFGGIDNAFTAADSWQLMDRGELWPIKLDTWDELPGDPGRGQRQQALRGLLGGVERLLGKRVAKALHAAVELVVDEAPKTLRRRTLVAKALLAVQRNVVPRLRRRAEGPDATPRQRKAFFFTDYGLALALAVLNSYELLQLPDHAGYRALDAFDYKEWLVRAGGMTDLSAAESPIIRNLYRTIAHEDITLAAGVCLYATVRISATWTGSPGYVMNAGMGDVVFAPLVDSLERRGVRFEYFHRVDRLEVDPERRRIRAIHMARQAELAPGVDRYTPTYELDSAYGPIQCWPNKPFWEQLRHDVDGADLRELPPHEGLESFHPIPGEAPVRLQLGRDYDAVLCGISVAALGKVASELCEHSPALRRHVDNGTRNASHTLGLQLWLDEPQQDLGWTDRDRVLCGTLPDPLNGYTDMTQVLDVERYDDGSGRAAPRSLAYFWGGLQHTLPAEFNGDDGPDELGHATHVVRHHLRAFWPNAFDGDDFRWDLLHAPDGVEGPDRMKHQYIPAIPNPSDMYIRSPKGSTQHRLRAGELWDEWGLVLVGDHIRTRFNMGLFEGAVESGIRGANAILGRPADTRTIG